MSIREKLSAIQSELIVPKKREMRSKTGRVMYKYRNLDDIFEALKPINIKHKVYFTIDEEIIFCGGILFRMATAKIHDNLEDGSLVSAATLVKENVDAGGIQSGEQKSGGSSSYASKLALSKLLLLDDNQDPDEKPDDKQESAPVSGQNKGDLVKILLDRIKESGIVATEDTKKWCSDLGVSDIKAQIKRLEAKIKESK